MIKADPRSPRSDLLTAAALAALMVLTRLGHFGEFSRLPDASWAVFFLGGMLLRESRAFAGFFALAWLVDVAALALGTPADCFSLAYLFLVPASAALWWAGRSVTAAGLTGRWRALGGTFTRLAFAVTVAFVVSNAGFFAFGGSADRITPVAYASAVAGYLPGYLLVTFAWVLVSLGALEAVRQLREVRATR